ncbi:hypothetical protein ETI08_03585 [Macrococcoides goetzii]|nr:hypothetical protein [Macrococcus goetzii]TDM48233.1 hypothetical protein ETI08_03585 [Macrococcus goetzii]
MKIKRERQVRLDELVKWIFENDIEDATFYAMNNEDNSVKVHVYIGGFIKTEYLGCPSKSDRFKITEEVEIDEDMILPRLVLIKEDKQVFGMKNTSIKRIKNNVINVKCIYLQNPDGSIGELIWTKQKGMVD